MLTPAQMQELVERMLKSSGRRIDVSQPFVDAVLPEGHRLHVVLEGISRGFSAVNIRKFVLRDQSASDLPRCEKSDRAVRRESASSTARRSSLMASMTACRSRLTSS